MQVHATEYLPVSVLPSNQTLGGAGAPVWMPLSLSAFIILTATRWCQHFQISVLLEEAGMAREGKRRCTLHTLEGKPLVLQSDSSAHLLNKDLNAWEAETRQPGLLAL